WMPTKLHAADIVDTGDAVDGLLSAGVDVDNLPDAVVRRGAELLDRMFGGCEREVIEARCLAWLDRDLAMRFGASVRIIGTMRLDDATGLYLPHPITPALDARRLKMDRMALEARELLGAGLSHDSSTSDNEPSWGSVDKTKLPRVAFAEKG